MQPKDDTTEVKDGYVSLDSQCPKAENGKHRWAWDGNKNVCAYCNAKTTQRVLCD